MDAIEYLKARLRMCASPYCPDCNMADRGGDVCRRTDTEDADPEKAVRTVEEWSEKHRPKTNGQKFKEVFGKAAIYVPDPFSGEWWDEPYKAPEE